MRKLVSGAVGILSVMFCYGQAPEIWQDYLEDKSNGVIPELNDYSFAGYHFSEKEIPDVDGWTHFNVVDLELSLMMRRLMMMPFRLRLMQQKTTMGQQSFFSHQVDSW